MAQITAVRALLEVIDNDRRGSQQMGVDLLFVLVVRADGGDERARRDVVAVQHGALGWRRRDDNLAVPRRFTQRSREPAVDAMFVERILAKLLGRGAVRVHGKGTRDRTDGS